MHETHLEAFTKGLEEERPEQVKGWREWVDRWEAVQHTTPEDSPFDLKEEGTYRVASGRHVVDHRVMQ